MSKLHFCHSRVIDLPALHNFNLGLQRLLLLMKIVLILIPGFINNPTPLKLLLIPGLFLNQANLMLPIPLNSKFKLLKSSHKLFLIILSHD